MSRPGVAGSGGLALRSLPGYVTVVDLLGHVRGEFVNSGAGAKVHFLLPVGQATEGIECLGTI